MTKKREPHKVAVPGGDVVELVALTLQDLGMRCRRVDDGSTVFYEDRDDVTPFPGTIVSVRAKKHGTREGIPVLSGRIEHARLDIPALGLPPLIVEPRHAPDLDRKAFSLERAVPRVKGEDPMELINGLDPEKEPGELVAFAMVLLLHDVRSIEAHAALGDALRCASLEAAARHFEIGVALGEHALGKGFTGCLPWRFYENQPFLHCLRDLGVCLVQLGRADEARAVLERAVALDPDNGQAAEKMVAAFDEAAQSDSSDPVPANEPSEPRKARQCPPVDLDEFLIAFDDNDPGHRGFVDLQTGEVFSYFEGGDNEWLPVEDEEELGDEERFLEIEPQPSHEGYQDMEDFAEACSDRRLGAKLDAALEGKRPFRRFKDVLLDHPAERERWFAFSNERVEACAKAWLDGEGIPYVEKKR
ncbi:MAG: UPF0158 family protein [Anaeromyxobacteraceae bacterium]